MKTSFAILSLLGSALAVSACASAPDGEQDSVARAASVKIHYTAFDPVLGKTVVRTEQITAQQAQWLLDARARNRESGQLRPLKGGTTTDSHAASSEHVGSASSALTSTSSDWNDCQWYDWVLFKNEPGLGGDELFCAKYTAGDWDTVVMPFVPHSFDAAASSSAFFNLCSSSSVYDCMVGECGGGSRWTTIWQSSGTADISPPSSVIYLMAQDFPMVC